MVVQRNITFKSYYDEQHTVDDVDARADEVFYYCSIFIA